MSFTFQPYSLSGHFIVLHFEMCRIVFEIETKDLMFHLCRAMYGIEVYMAEFTPEKSKQIALARLDVIHQWLEFRKKSKNKLHADYDFVKLHNTSDSHLFEILKLQALVGV